MSKIILNKESYYTPEEKDELNRNEKIFYIDYVQSLLEKLAEVDVQNDYIDEDGNEQFKYGASLRVLSDDDYILTITALSDLEKNKSYDYLLKAKIQNDLYLVCEYEKVKFLV